MDAVLLHCALEKLSYVTEAVILYKEIYTRIFIVAVSVMAKKN